MPIVLYVYKIRIHGGNKKDKALRLDTENFSWGSKCSARKTRIIDVVYNQIMNEYESKL